MLLDEAVRLGHADANPLVSLKLKRDRAAKKPEMSADEICVIREALKEEPEWIELCSSQTIRIGKTKKCHQWLP